MSLRTQVGIGVLLTKTIGRQVQILLGLRKGSYGDGDWGFPGGKPEFMEAFDACACRETREETGIEIVASNLTPLTWTDDKFIIDGSPAHFATLYYACTQSMNYTEPKLLETEKCER